MIKNTPLEYINDKIKDYLNDIEERNERIRKYEEQIKWWREQNKAIEIRLTELNVIRDILEKDVIRDESIN